MSITSVITPSFNRAKLVEATLQSLLQQSESNWECIIVDDGSTDNSLEIISKYVQRDPRFKLFVRDRGPKGACTCRNIGVEKSSGEYLIFLDTDDLLAPHCIDQRTEIMKQHPELDLAIFPTTIFKNQPGDVNKWWNIETDRDLLTRQLHQDAICQGTGCIWKKSSFIQVGRWNEGLNIWQDIDLFLKTWIEDYQCRVCFDRPADLHYRCHASLSTEDFFNRQKIESRCTVIKKAVERMKINGKDTYVRESRFMAAETILGAARSGNIDLAKDLLEWTDKSDVFLQRENTTLWQVIIACQTYAWRIPFVRNWLQDKLRIFKCTTLLGKINTAEPLIQRKKRDAVPTQLIAAGI